MINSNEWPGTALTVPAVVNTLIGGADVAKGICSVDGCDRPLTAHGARGLCPTHYMRFARHGDPGGGAIESRSSTTLDRFNRYADVSGGPDACWPWTGHLSRDGYGRVRVGARSSVEAYRAVYELSVGPIPTGLQLDHLCRNRRCVNPAHLEPVTHDENLRRGRASRMA